MTSTTKPLFSIIVPVFNTEKYLRKCVDSILGQRFTDFEVVLVDDGSPDGSGAICDQYAQADSRICVIHKENGGLVSARKAGLTQCHGKYIINVDSDDYIADDLLTHIADVLQKHHPQVIMYGAIRFPGTLQKVKHQLPEGLYTGDRMQIIRDNLIHNDHAEQPILYTVWSIAVQYEMYLPFQNAVPQTISRGEDLALTAPLLNACQTVYVMDYCGYYYRNNPTSIMNTFRKTEITQMKELLYFLSHNLGMAYENKLDIYAVTHYFDFLDRAMQRGNYHEYRRIIRDTLDDELATRFCRAKCAGGVKLRLVFFLLRNQWFFVLWMLRKLQRIKD